MLFFLLLLLVLVLAILSIVFLVLYKLMNAPIQASQTQQQQPKMTADTNKALLVQRVDVCPFCGRKVKSGILFCNNCGTKLPSSQKTEITDSESVKEKYSTDRGIAAWPKKTGAKKILNIICIILSVVSLLIACVVILLFYWACR